VNYVATLKADCLVRTRAVALSIDSATALMTPHNTEGRLLDGHCYFKVWDRDGRQPAWVGVGLPKQTMVEHGARACRLPRYPTCTVRVFDRNLHSRMPLSFTPLLRLKLLQACDAMAFLSDVHFSNQFTL
jgi:hypothetical protein